MGQKTEPWEDRGWILGEQLPGGVQGHTFLARRRDDDPTSFNYVLKRLKRQDDAIRRRRFHIEAASLQAISALRVARLEDSNADQFRELSTKLFVVTERIFGPDLETFASLPVSIETACRILTGVLSTVEECHQVPVLHRDIKPCHVILRHGDHTDAVLIDFGLAFNEENAEGLSLTAPEQGVGNRFIILPEQLHGKTKRDHRSDVTQCLGLLFFLLTGQNPGIILTPEGKRPHELVDLESIVREASHPQIARLRRIFDVGFEFNPDSRWQSAADLNREISLLTDLDSLQNSSAFSARLAEIAGKAKRNPEIDFHRRSSRFFADVVKTAQERVNHVTRECQGLLTVEQGQVRTTSTQLKLQFVLKNAAFESSPSQMIVMINRNADTLLLDATLLVSKGKQFAGMQESKKLAQKEGVSLVDPSALHIVESFLEDVWVKGLNIYMAV